MVGEASLLHMSGPDVQQLFAQAVGVGKNVGAVVGFAVVGSNVVAIVGAMVGVEVVKLMVGVFVLHEELQIAIYEGVPPF